GSHTRPVARGLPGAGVVPAGRKAAEGAAATEPGRAVISRWLVMSDNQTAPSPLPLARVVPSGLNATDSMLAVGPVRGRRGAMSHSRTVPSMLPLARVLPPGLNATELTALLRPVNEVICQ